MIQNVFSFGKILMKIIKYLIITYQNIQKHFQKPSRHILTIIAQELNQCVPRTEPGCAKTEPLDLKLPKQNNHLVNVYKFECLNNLTLLKLETVYFFHLSLKIKKLCHFKNCYTIPHIRQISTAPFFHEKHHIFSYFHLCTKKNYFN